MRIVITVTMPDETLAREGVEMDRILEDAQAMKEDLEEGCPEGATVGVEVLP